MGETLDKILYLVSGVAPSFFVSVVSLFVVLNVTKFIINFQKHRYEKITQSLLKQQSELEGDIENIEEELSAFRDDSRGCKVCTKDTESGCLADRMTARVRDLEAKQVRIIHGSKKLERSLRWLLILYESPLGKILFFLGNTDGLNERRQS